MKSTIPLDVKTAGPAAVDHYKKCIKKGTSPRMAEMFALRAAPALETDTNFLVGIGDLRKQFHEKENLLEGFVAEARKEGANPGRNDFYNDGLARYAGDREAWVPHDSARSYIKNLRKKREAEAKEKAEQPDVKLHPRIVREAVHTELEKDPSKGKDLGELQHSIIEKHGAQD